jgi:predicted DNA-binding transcriptional regulator YafY
MRADRLVSVALLLQARGPTTALALAADLEVSVRTVYRDLDALRAAGVPVIAEPGPGGGCRLLDGYRFPLCGLRPDEAEALLILGVPAVLRELGLDRVLTSAQRQVQVTAGLDGGEPLVHLDMPGWFRSQEPVPHLRVLAEALKTRRHLVVSYGSDGGRRPRILGPLGLVNKAGVWYLVAAVPDGAVRVFRGGRITAARVRPEPFERPAGFGLAGFWARWSAEFAASRAALAVRLRASAAALAIFPEVFGDGVRAALDAASPPDAHGWRAVTLSFEHAPAAAHRLAGFGGQVEVLSPDAVRGRLLAVAQEIIDCYRTGTSPGPGNENGRR